MAPLVVESASGVRLRLAEPAEGASELVDGMSSWWSAIHGYAPPGARRRRPRAARAHEPRHVRRAHPRAGGAASPRRLVEITPEPLRHVFLADSGSVSVEVAVKMCLQHWRSLGRPEKRRLCTWRGGYYGDTLQPMSVCDPEGGMHHLWAGVLPEQVFADAPPGRLRRARRPRLRRAPRRPGRRARGRARGHHRRAGGAGRGRHALPLARVPASPCGRSPTATTCCWSSTRSPPASAAPARSSPPSTPASRPT